MSRATVAIAMAQVVFVLGSCGGSSDAPASADAPAAAAPGPAPSPAPSPSPSPAPAPAPAAPSTAACDGATGRILLVGPGKTYAVPSAAAAVAQSGDVIKIDPGDYRGDVATWNASNLTICGAGARPRLFADGKNAQGKGIWVVGGSNVTVENVEFHDASVPDRNGAGIRMEGGGNQVVRRCGFFDNENGILAGNAATTITVDRSEFARNGYGDGQSHNIYVGRAGRVTVTASFFHEAKIGHNFKSRAKENRIENSYFMDGPNGTSSYLADFPEGGAVYLRGNLFHKGPLADNAIAIAYGAEGITWTTNTLEMVHNTVVSTKSGGAFLSAPSTTLSIKLTANILAGTNSPALITGSFPPSGIVQQHNLVTAAGNFAGADSIGSPDFWPNAAVQAQTALADVPDPGYTQDAPQPFSARAITTATRRIGALQSAP